VIKKLSGLLDLAPAVYSSSHIKLLHAQLSKGRFRPVLHGPCQACVRPEVFAATLRCSTGVLNTLIKQSQTKFNKVFRIQFIYFSYMLADASIKGLWELELAPTVREITIMHA